MTDVNTPQRTMSRGELIVIAVVAGIGLIVLPCLNAFTAPDSIFHVSNFTITVYGKYICSAVLAMGVNWLWATPVCLAWASVFFSLWEATPLACT